MTPINMETNQEQNTINQPSDYSTMVSTLLQEIRNCGGFRSQLSWEFALAMVVSITTATTSFLLEIEPPSSLYSTIFTASAAMLGLTVTAYSLILSIGSDDFKKVFHRHESFRELRVSFSITAIVLGVSIVVSIILLTISPLLAPPYSSIVIAMAMFPCLWGVFSIVMIVSNALRMIGEIITDDS